MIDIIIGIAFICFLLIYFAFKLDKEHYILQILLIFFSISLLLLIPKATLDNNCINVLNNTIQITSESYTNTTYVYSSVCYAPTENNTNTTFFKLIAGLLWIFWIYVFTFFIYKLLLHLGVITKK